MPIDPVLRQYSPSQAAIVAVGFALMLGTLSAAQGPPEPAPPATCEARILDVQEELINTQEALAVWQARAIRAEAQLARAAIAQQRTAAAAAGKEPRE